MKGVHNRPFVCEVNPGTFQFSSCGQPISLRIHIDGDGKADFYGVSLFSFGLGKLDRIGCVVVTSTDGELFILGIDEKLNKLG
jgi:hypothetical protein